MDQHVTNPFNKLDLARLPVEAAITLADLLLFGDVTASGKKERIITVQQFLEVLFPANLRLAAVAAESGIVLSDHLVFVDNSAAAPNERKVTLDQLLTVITPVLTTSLTPAITPPGVIMPYVGLTAPTGWLLSSGYTIGSATSGATARANADTSALYNLLWASYGNAQLPIQDSVGVPGVRGASAAIDFAANKRLPLPDLRGRVIAGKDDMAGTAANRLTLLGSGITGSVNGSTGGNQAATLTTAELPAHTHNTTVPTTVIGSGTAGATGDAPGPPTVATSTSAGGGLPFSITQPTFVTNYIIKL